MHPCSGPIPCGGANVLAAATATGPASSDSQSGRTTSTPTTRLGRHRGRAPGNSRLDKDTTVKVHVCPKESHQNMSTSHPQFGMTERIRPRALATLDLQVRQLDRAPLVVDRVDAAEVADEELSPRGHRTDMDDRPVVEDDHFGEVHAV
jgi:hypothetical protein